MAWLQLRVFTQHPDFADELLTAYGAEAVSFVDGADTPILEPGVGETPLWPDTVTLGFFQEHVDPAPAIAALKDALPEGQGLRIETVLIEDQDWVRAWLDNWHPQRISERLWVVPREKREQVSDPSATVLLLDPGLAFGTGTHPSTHLCLEWLAQADVAGKRVLDFGCGSGILAIAALLLGAKEAVCVDIDPQALTATLDNAEVNGVADKVKLLLPHEFEPQAYDLVLANILANPLIALAPMLAQCAKPGAPLVLAGLLARQADEVRAAYAPWFSFNPDGEKDGWHRINGQCRLPGLINAHTIGDWLTAGQPQLAHFPQFKAQGITAVINLAMPSSAGFLAQEADLCAGLGMAYTYIGIPWEAPTPQHFDRFCSAMDALDGQKVLVHCAANKRVSAFMYLYRTLHLGLPDATCQADLDALWQPNPVWAAFIAAMRQK